MKINYLILIIVLFSCSNKPEVAKPISLFDQANTTKYNDQNSVLLKQENKMDRVVFMGNSITEMWPDVSPEYFAENTNYLCFGKDVLDLEPKVVVLLAGINDIAENSGPIPLEQIAENIEMMAALADHRNIKVILCAVLPAFDFPWRPGLDPVNKVLKLNDMIQAIASANGYRFVDYHSAMKDDKNGLKVPEYTTAEDLVHPNEKGYVVMENLIQPVIESVLSSE